MKLSFRRFSLRSLLLFVLLAGSVGGLWYRWEPWVCVHVLGGQQKHWRPTISSDQSKILTCFDMGPFKVWDIHSGELLFTGATEGMAFFRGAGKHIYVQGIYTERTVNEDTLEIMPPIEAESRDGRYAVLGKTDQYEVWDMDRPEKMTNLPVGFVRPFDFSNDGELLLTQREIWNWKTRKTQALFPQSLESYFKFFLPDNRYVGANRIKSVENKEHRFAVIDVTSGNAILEGDGFILVDSDELLFVDLKRTTTRIFNPKTLSQPINLPGYRFDFSRSPDGKRILTYESNSENGNRLHCWDCRTGGKICTWSPVPLFYNPLTIWLHDRLIIMPDHNIDSKAVILPLSKDTPSIVLPCSEILSFDKQIVSADQKKLLCCSIATSEATIYDIESGEALASLKNPKSRIELAFFIGDGGTICTSSTDSVRIWHQRRDERTRVWQLPELWLAIVLLIGLGWSVGRDVRGM